MVGKWIGLIAIGGFQVSPNQRCCKLALSHGHGQTKRKDGIDEPMCVPNADKAVAAKPIYLIRIVRDDVNILDQLDFWNPPTQLRMKLAQFSNVKITFALFLMQEVSRRTNYSHTHDLIIERDKPTPVIFFLVKDQGVIFVSFTSPTVVPHGIDYLREDGDLLVVRSQILWTCDAAEVCQPSGLSGA